MMNNARSEPPVIKSLDDRAALADAVQWFLDHDPRVAAIRHPAVEELFQWKQTETERERAETFHFDSAEDRLAIGIFQALQTNPDERALHDWIGDVLAALDESAKLNEEISGAYDLQGGEEASALAEARKIPSERERSFYLTACWLEALCTAEARILGWIYQGLYGRAFHPNNF